MEPATAASFGSEGFLLLGTSAAIARAASTVETFRLSPDKNVYAGDECTVSI